MVNIFSSDNPTYAISIHFLIVMPVEIIASASWQDSDIDFFIYLFELLWGEIGVMSC